MEASKERSKVLRGRAHQWQGNIIYDVGSISALKSERISGAGLESEAIKLQQATRKKSKARK